MIKRKLEAHLLRLAKQYAVITLTGPRQSGKTTLCRNTFQQHDYVSLENIDERMQAKEDPRGFLARFPGGVVLDEIQRAPDLVSYIQGMVDDDVATGRFILTGSQQFEVTHKINQSLAGRTAILRLLPFSYDEIYQQKRVEINKVIYKGFYPRIHDKKLNPTEALSFYTSTYIERDLLSLIKIKELHRFERFLKICASNVGQILNYSRISNDCGVSIKTIKSWISVLEASYVVFLLPPHFNNFRKRIVKSPKLYFYDVGLAAFLLGISSESHVDSHPLKGYLFESFIVSEFIKKRFNHVQQSNLYYFRDNNGNEVDLILDFGNKVNAVEIKSSSTIISAYFKGLDFYTNLNKNLEEKYLLYGGEKKSKFKNVTVYPYHLIGDIPMAFEI